MSVFEIIERRRSIGKVTEQSPTREQIEHILHAATHAPNHRKVEPWRFFVLAGRARQELGEILIFLFAGTIGRYGKQSSSGYACKGAQQTVACSCADRSRGIACKATQRAGYREYRGSSGGNGKYAVNN